MSHSDHRTLIDRGRKAGLRTSELYGALAAARRTDEVDPAGGQADCNGFILSYDQNGQRVYLPASDTPRP
jgi:hypothetical protein